MVKVLVEIMEQVAHQQGFTLLDLVMATQQQVCPFTHPKEFYTLTKVCLYAFMPEVLIIQCPLDRYLVEIFHTPTCQQCNFHNLCFDRFGCNFVQGLIGVLISMCLGPSDGRNVGGNYRTSGTSTGVQTGKSSNVNTSVGMSIYLP